MSLVVVALGLSPATSLAARPPKPIPVPRTHLADARDDDALDRLQHAQESRGVFSTGDTRAFLGEAQKQRQDYGHRFPDAAEYDGDAPVWESLGPTSARRLQNDTADLRVVDSGRLRTILVSPDHPETVYVLSSGGGLWRTRKFSDPKAPWEPLTDSVGGTSGGGVALGGDDETLYLGAGDPFDPAPGGFMIRSNDGGRSWSAPFILPGATTILDVKVDSARGRDIVLVGTDVGLFRSTDGGKSYAAVPSLSLGTNQVWSLVRTSAGWLASSQDSDGSGIPSTLTTTLYLSTDHGGTFVPTGNGFSREAARTTLGVGVAGDAVVYAFAANAQLDQLDLFRSGDGGLTFAALNLPAKTPVNPNDDQPDMDIMHSQAWYNQMLLIDPTDAARNTVYLGGNLSTARTTDGGATWKLVTNWLAGFGLPYAHADFHCAAFSPQNHRIYFGSDGGVFWSGDGGATWNSERNTGLVDDLAYALTASPIHPDESLIGLQDNGTRYRLPGTTVYNQVIGGDGFGVGWSQANDKVSLGSVYYSQIYRSIDNPPDDQNKFQFAADTIVDYQYNFFTALTTPPAKSDPTGLVFFTFTPTFVYATGDGAATWTEIGNIDEGNGYGLSNIAAGPPFTVFFRDVVHGLGASPDLQHVGVVATGGRVALSSDGGTTWSVVALNQAVPGFKSFTSNVTWSNDNKTVFVTSVNPSASAVHVVKSTDAGRSWAAAQTGLPSVGVHRLLADPSDPTGNHLYAATLLGVYFTTDAGAHWKLLGAGLPQVSVTDLYSSPTGKELKIATYGRGIWRLGLGNNNQQQVGQH